MARPRDRVFLLAAAFLLIAGATARAEDVAGPFDVPIYLTDTAGTMRVGEMVRSGVPLPESAGVTDPGGLYLLRQNDRGEWAIEVPVQARITSRWGGTVADTNRPAKWVLLDFPASVARDSREEYRLRYDADGTRGTWQKNQPDSAGLVSDQGDRFRVDTGAVRFEVRKDRFGIFENMEVRAERNGEVVWEPMTGESAFDVPLVDSSGVEFRPSLVEPQEVIPEELGPLVSVLRIKGQFANRDGDTLKDGWIGYTIRLHVYAGSAFTRVYFTLENNGLYGLEADWSVKDNTPKWLYFDRLSLDLTAGFSGETHVRTGPVSEKLGENGEGRFRLYQDHEIRRIPEDLANESRNFYADVRVGDRSVFRGDRSSGVVRVSDGRLALTSGVRHFWQNYPKAVSYTDGLLSLELWPTEGYWPNNEPGAKAGTYQFEGGRYKTYEVGYDFAPNQSSDPEVMAARLGSPLFGRAPAEWYAKSRAIDFLAPDTFPIGNRAITTALRRFNQMQEAYVDVTRAEPQPKTGTVDPRFVVPPVSITTQRESRGNVYVAGSYDIDFYGWFTFGDTMSNYGWCSVHQDLPQGMLLQYLRHNGKREFLDIAEEMIRHRYDIDQYHNKESKHTNWFYFNGFQRMNRGWHGDYDRMEAYRSELSPQPGYTWLTGLLLHNALTGDPRSLEAARENAEAFYNYYRIAVRAPEMRSPIRDGSNLRNAVMALKGLVEFYIYTGEKKYLHMAEDVYANHLRYTEELVGNNGFLTLQWKVTRDGDRIVPTSKAEQELEVIVLALEPLRKLHMVNHDPEVLAFLTRILNRLKSIMLQVSGHTNLGRYLPLQLPTKWVAGRPDGAESWYGFMLSDAYAYVFLETGEPGFLEFARWLFRDSVIYFQAGAYKLVRPEFESEISWTPRKYPHTEAVVNAMVLRGHQVYLFTEWGLAARGAPTFHFPNDDFRVAGGANRLEKENESRVPLTNASEGTHHRRTPDFTGPVVSVKDIKNSGRTSVVTVVTNELASVQIEYGESTRNTTFTPRPFGSNRVHDITLTGLEPGRSYFYRVHARDLAENTTTTEFRPLRTVVDQTPPRVVRVTTPQEDRVVVEFSEPVVRDDAGDKAHYQIEGVTISEALVDSTGRRTTLITNPLVLGKPYALHVSSIRDLASPANEIAGSGVASARRFYREIVGDDSGGTFRVISGDWGQTSTDLDSYAGETRFAKQVGDGIARVEWRIPVPETAYYEIYAWWPNSPLSREVASIAQYRIRYHGGLSTPTTNQRYRGGQWVMLGVFPFRAEDGAVIGLSTDGADGTVLADAIRLVYTTMP